MLLAMEKWYYSSPEKRRQTPARTAERVRQVWHFSMIDLRRLGWQAVEQQECRKVWRHGRRER